MKTIPMPLESNSVYAVHKIREGGKFMVQSGVHACYID